MANLVKFGAVDPAAEQADTAAMNAGGWFKWQVGLKNYIRIFPPLAGEKRTLHRVAKHYVEIPGRQNKVVFNCPQKMARSHCAVCDMVERLSTTGNPVDQERAKKMNAAQGMIGVLVDRGHLELGPQKFQFTGAAYDQFQAMLNMMRPGAHYSDPVRGHDVLVVKSGTGFDTTWSMRDQERGPLGSPAEVEEWLANMPSLARDLRVPSGEEVAQLLGLPGAAPSRRATRTAQDASDADFEEVDKVGSSAAGAGDDDVPF